MNLTQLVVQSGIINPAINPKMGSGGVLSTPNTLAVLIATLWRILFTLGGLAVIIFMASGAFMWITSGGDKGKVETARERITASVIGMMILFSMFALVNYVFPLIGFNILSPSIQNNL